VSGREPNNRWERESEGNEIPRIRVLPFSIIISSAWIKRLHVVVGESGRVPGQASVESESLSAP